MNVTAGWPVLPGAVGELMGPVMATTIVCSTKGSQNKGGYHNIFTTRILYTHSSYVEKNKNEGLGFIFKNLW